jgi:hypothetical protein
LEASAGKTGGDIAGAREIFAERLWHRAVREGGEIRFKELTPVGEANKKVECKKLTTQFRRTRRFTKEDLSDLIELKLDDYCLSDNNEFLAVDAIAVLTEDPHLSD